MTDREQAQALELLLRWVTANPEGSLAAQTRIFLSLEQTRPTLRSCGPGCYLCRVGAGGAHRKAEVR